MARARTARTTSRRRQGALAAALDRAGLLPGRGAAITLIALAAIGIGAIIRATTYRLTRQLGTWTLSAIIHLIFHHMFETHIVVRTDIHFCF